jgi:hypothetical protein
MRAVQLVALIAATTIFACEDNARALPRPWEPVQPGVKMQALSTDPYKKTTNSAKIEGVDVNFEALPADMVWDVYDGCSGKCAVLYRSDWKAKVVLDDLGNGKVYWADDVTFSLQAFDTAGSGMKGRSTGARFSMDHTRTVFTETRRVKASLNYWWASL